MPRQVHILPKPPARPQDSHKGTFGRVLLVAGTPGMCGAAILCARAALRAGAGLVTIAAPRSLATTLACGVPEAILRFLPELDAATEPVVDTSGFDALAIGPGLGTSPWSRSLVTSTLAGLSIPHVVDADALNVLAEDSSTESGGKSEASGASTRIWTPHPGEFERLCGERPRGERDRVAASERFVAARGGVLVLKGHHTVVHAGDRYAINLSGNAGMATAGAGDVLTGVIASLLAQGMAAFDAAHLGTHLHGLAGDLAAQQPIGDGSPEAPIGSIPSLIASDLVNYLGAAWRTLSSR